MQRQLRVFSGVRPSGELHIGNYLGAIKQWVRLQEDHEVFFGIMDLHAITTPHDPAELRQQTIDAATAYLAAGLDLERVTILVQSHVPAHAELAWILGTMTPLGELERMTQFKEKGRELESRVGLMAGLLNYPVLMAADILLYQANVVPVGEDQVQHVELSRSVAERFNNRYGETFTVPEAMIQKETARIMSLTEPEKKMSKSDESDRGYILLADSTDAIREKIKAAVTDSGQDIVYKPKEKPAISNLLVIFSEFSGVPIPELETRYRGKGYAAFKSDLVDAVIAGLKPFQEQFQALRQDEQHILKILEDGSRRAATVAEQTLSDVKRKIGLL